MEKLVLIVHSLAALIIIGLVLIQQGKGAAAGASFGAGASQTVFGSEGSGNFFTRATWIIVALFFATSFGLAMLAKSHSKVAAEANMPSVQQEVPAVQSEIPTADVPSVDAVSDVPASVGSEVAPSQDGEERK